MRGFLCYDYSIHLRLSIFDLRETGQERKQYRHGTVGVFWNRTNQQNFIETGAARYAGAAYSGAL